MAELGKYLGEQFKQQKSDKEGRGLEPGVISNYFTFGNYNFKIRVVRVLVEKQDVSSIGVWGNGVWGEDVWNDESGLPSYTTVEEIILNQTIPTIAREEIAKFINSESSDNPSYMAVGGDSTAYAEADTALGTEFARKVISYDISNTKQVDYIMTIMTTDNSFYKSFDEDFTTTTLKDTTDTTADWTTTGTCSFTSGEIAQSTEINSQGALCNFVTLTGTTA